MFPLKAGAKIERGLALNILNLHQVKVPHARYLQNAKTLPSSRMEIHSRQVLE